MFRGSVMLNFISPLICRHILKQSSPALRNLSLIQHLKPRSVLLDKSKHKIIYEFSFIKPTAYVIRTKIWVPALMTLVAPIGLLISDIRVTILGGLVASWLHSALVHQMSKLAGNMIGKVYINKENDFKDIIISVLDTNGNRIDRHHEIKDLIICDFSTKMSHALGFINIHVNNTSTVYQMNIVNCKIYDLDSFATLFGSKWVLNKSNDKTA